ncbi:MAG: hypothetical protein FJW80_03715 [Actinobacteria bacterium]|nr:hypothetical protein [Actinomycetota bacterium]
MIWPADLKTPQARALEAELTGADPLAAISAVRRAHPEIDPALVSTVATQARGCERGSATCKTADVDMSAEEMPRRIGHRGARDGAAITVAFVRVAEGMRAYEVTR